LADRELLGFRSRLLVTLADPRADGVALAKGFKELIEQVGKDTAAQRRRAALVVRLLVQGLEAALMGDVGTDPEDAKTLEPVQALGHARLVQLVERCLAASEQIERRVQLVLVVEALVDALISRRPELVH
jgi:hypothetical protein